VEWVYLALETHILKTVVNEYLGLTDGLDFLHYQSDNWPFKEDSAARRESSQKMKCRGNEGKRRVRHQHFITPTLLISITGLGI
jgi:hypothetical protein